MTIDIANLRDAPEFLPQIADRIWRAWWKPGGNPLAELEQRLSTVTAATDFPFNLVAIADGHFAGTVTAIPSDLDERPELTPWVAALWVEPEFRRMGIGRALVEQAVQALFALQHPQVYLYATPALRDLYLALGWTLFEPNAGADGVDIFVRYSGQVSAPLA